MVVNSRIKLSRLEDYYNESNITSCGKKYMAGEK